jgi:hypothetical protein
VRKAVTMENVSPEVEQFVRSCEYLLSESPPLNLSEQERCLIEYYGLELFSKYGIHKERKRSGWASIITGV